MFKGRKEFVRLEKNTQYISGKGTKEIIYKKKVVERLLRKQHKRKAGNRAFLNLLLREAKIVVVISVSEVVIKLRSV